MKSIFSLLSLEISELASIAVKYDRILAHLSDVIVSRSDTIDMDVSLDNGALSDSARRLSWRYKV
jgi:hypothetical protein